MCLSVMAKPHKGTPRPGIGSKSHGGEKIYVIILVTSTEFYLRKIISVKHCRTCFLRSVLLTVFLDVGGLTLTFKNRVSYIQDGRTATLQMLNFIYFFSTNISTEYFKHAAHSPLFSSKCRLFHNATFFGSCIIHILHTGVLKFKCKI